MKLDCFLEHDIGLSPQNVQQPGFHDGVWLSYHHMQILGRCIAGANSPIDAVRRGVRQWLALGVPAKKLVLGLPWYGYDYVCQGPDAATPPLADVDLCPIKPVTFQNVSCSDAAGAQRCYGEIMACELSRWRGCGIKVVC